MGVIGDLEVQITGSADSLNAALKQAESGIRSFSQIASGVFAGVLGANIFTSITSGITKIGRSLLDSSSQFESYATSLGILLEGIGTTGEDTAESFKSSSGKVALLAMEAKNELIDYTEKIKDLNKDIQDTLDADNVVREQRELTEKLAEIAYDYARRVKSIQQEIDDAATDLTERKARRQEGLDNRLLEMQEDHDASKEEKTKKWEAEYAYIRNSRLKAALRKQFDDELKADDEAFKARLDLKKKQEERRIALENARDKEETDVRVKELKDRLAKEEELNKHQVELAKKDSEERISLLKEENEKRLHMLREQLDREERMHLESLARMKQAEAGVAAAEEKMGLTFAPGDPFAATKVGREEMLTWISKFRSQAPIFDDKSIFEATMQLTAFGVDARKVLPIIGDMAAAMHKDLGSTIDTVFGGMTGRMRGLTLQFGIQKRDLEEYGAKFDETGRIIDAGSFFAALEKIRNARFADGIERQSRTLTGVVAALGEKMEQLGRKIMGVDETKGVIKGGALDLLTQGIVGLQKGLASLTGGPEFKALSESIKRLIADLKPLEPLISQVVLPVLKALVTFLAKALIVGIKDCIDRFDALAKVFGVVATVITGALETIRGGWSRFVSDITGFIERVKKGLEDLGNWARDHLSYLNPFAKHSPSLFDDVQRGVEMIRKEYASLQSLPMPSFAPLAPRYVQNYNYNTTTKSPVINQSNSFTVQGQANAQNISEFLGFQLEHLGIF